MQKGDFTQVPAHLKAKGMTLEQWTEVVHEVLAESLAEGKLGSSVIIRSKEDGYISRYDLTSIAGEPGLKVTRLLNPSEINPSKN